MHFVLQLIIFVTQFKYVFMASLSFNYRSKKEKAFLEARFSYRIEKNGTPISFYTRSKIEVKKEYWKSQHKKRSNDPVIQKMQNNINSQITELRTFVLNEFDKSELASINRDWFLNTVKNFYYSKEIDKQQTQLPNELIKYFDYYINERKGEIKVSSIRKYRVIQNKLKRLENHYNISLKVEDVNENFRRQFKEFCNIENYSQNTRQRELVLIKTVCFNAKYNGIKTSHQLEGLKFKREVVKHPYLSLAELEVIKNKELKSDYLDNARDWLLISCFTAQRVSDFMKFTKENIRIEDDKYYLDFKQQKTNKLTTIPILKQVIEVLEKRNGNFPRPISDQKYNDYIKEVCEACEIDEIIKGKIRICIAPEGVKPQKHHYRDVIREDAKHNFISSHIGRRSFATNHYGKVPTSHLIRITNHATEAQFLNYIQKADKDLAKDAHQYFN